MKTSKVFKIAKKHLSKTYEDTLTGPQQFICNALELAHDVGEITDDNCMDCQCIVQERMEGAVTLEAWLILKGYLPQKFLHDKELCQRIQDYRHAWVNELIREFEAKGD